MNTEAFSYEKFIPLTELFPVHNIELNPNSPCLIISKPSDSTSLYIAKIAQYHSGISMEKTHIFPLFVDALTGKGQMPNLNASLIHEFEKRLSLAFVSEMLPDPNVCFANSEEVRPEFKSTFYPIDVFNYVIGVINSRDFVKTYGDFPQNIPRIPYPKNPDTFWRMAEQGRKCS